ncbi:glycyl-radical activating family protein [Desulforhopalus sp. 52FAK]
MYNAEKCIGCRSCVEACPENACTLSPEGIVTDMALCTSCGQCAEVCPTLATEMSGKYITAKEVVEQAEKERVFFEESGGGITFSGGEPLQQADFLIPLLDELGRRKIHRAVDTTGFTTTLTLLEVAKRTDLFLYDLKMMDSIRHKKYTGVENEQILKNLKALAESGANINIRIPFIAGVNDDEENIKETALFISSLAGQKKAVNLLPYHNIAANKYRRLGQVHNSEDMAEPSEDTLKKAVNVLSDYNLKVTIGG